MVLKPSAYPWRIVASLEQPNGGQPLGWFQMQKKEAESAGRRRQKQLTSAEQVFELDSNCQCQPFSHLASHLASPNGISMIIQGGRRLY